MPQNIPVTRIHRSWLAERERNVLVQLAGRLPKWVTPDYLTLLGLAGAVLCGASFWASAMSPRFLWLACLGLALNWLGDSLDGSLARHRKTERQHYGFFIDHTTDIVSQTFIFLGLGASPYIRFEMACLLLMSYWIAALYTFIRAIATQIFQISYFGIGPTEIRIGLISYALCLLTVGPYTLDAPFGAVTPLDAISAVVFVTVFLSFLCMIWVEGRRLAALDAAAINPRTPVEPRRFGLEPDSQSAS